MARYPNHFGNNSVPMMQNSWHQGNVFQLGPWGKVYTYHVGPHQVGPHQVNEQSRGQFNLNQGPYQQPYYPRLFPRKASGSQKRFEAQKRREVDFYAKCAREAIAKAEENEAKTKAEEKDRLEAEKKNRLEAELKTRNSAFEQQTDLQAFTGVKFLNEDGQNKCYINTCLNAILSSDTVRKAVWNYSGQCQCELCKYLLYILDNQSLIHDAKDLRTWSHMRDTKFGTSDQQDIDEFFYALINQCKVLKEVFQFDTIQKRVCKNCQYVSYSRIEADNITLECPIDTNENAINNTQAMLGNDTSSILDKRCDYCKSNNPVGTDTAHSVTEYFTKMPKVFVVTVKRNFNDESKIDKDVLPTPWMNLTDLNDIKHEYYLKSVAKHGGHSGGGHYTCAINLAFAWRICDDDKDFKVVANVPLDGYLCLYELKIEAIPRIKSLTQSEIQEIDLFQYKKGKNSEDFTPMTPPMTPYSMISTSLTPVSQHPAIAKKFVLNEVTPMTPDSMISTPGTPALVSPTHVTPTSVEQNHENKIENDKNSVANFTYEMILAMNPDLHLSQDPSEKVSNTEIMEVQKIDCNIEELAINTSANILKEFESSMAKKSCESEKVSNTENMVVHEIVSNIEELENNKNNAANISKEFESSVATPQKSSESEKVTNTVQEIDSNNEDVSKKFVGSVVIQNLPRASLDQNDELLKQFEKFKIKQAVEKCRKNEQLKREMKGRGLISDFQMQTFVTTPSASYTKKRVRQGTQPNVVKRKRTENVKPENQPKPKVKDVIDDFVLPGLLN